MRPGSQQAVETAPIVQIGPIFDDLNTLREQLEQGLQEVRWWMKEVHCDVSKLHDSQSQQSTSIDVLLHDVQFLLSISRPSFQRKEAAPDGVAPLEDPPLLSFPGQLDEVVCDSTCASDDRRESTESRNDKLDVKELRQSTSTKRKKHAQAKAKAPRHSHATTLDELEVQTAKDLLVRKQSSHTLQSIREATEASSDESECYSPISKSKTRSRRGGLNHKTSGSDKNAILGKCHRMSLDELREHHDAAVCVEKSYSEKTIQEESTQLPSSSSPMPVVAKLWLQLLCILPLQPHYRWLGHFWTLSVLLILLAPTTLLAWLLVTEKVDTIMTSTVLCYLVGVIAAAWSLRRANIQELLGSSDGSMEQQLVSKSIGNMYMPVPKFFVFLFVPMQVFVYQTCAHTHTHAHTAYCLKLLWGAMHLVNFTVRYAFLCGFSQDWRQVSTRRFKEVLAFLVLILGCRWSVHLSEGLQHGFEPSVTFSMAAVGFAAIAYTQLHMVAGLELAIDSFSINFFRDMDCGKAVDEWNVLQATLRQISTRLSESMLILAISCGASMLFLIEIAFLQSDENHFIPGDLNDGFPLLLFTAWVFPPILLFLYVLMRSAGVTEKASRVAPLVNSWNLDLKDVDDGPEWMDLRRQYIVQYIKQSETGFYMHGVKLHGFQVTKLGYYFGAFVFAIISKIG